jgi:hypothetical protein
MLERDHALQDVVDSAEYQAVIKRFFQEDGYKDMDAEDKRNVLQNHTNLDVVLPILQKYAPKIKEIENLVISIRSAQSNAQKEFDRKVMQLQIKLAEANLYTRYKYSGSPGYRRDALDVNWRTLHSYKKGGKVEDRLLKYLEHNRKVLKDQQERNAVAEK